MKDKADSQNNSSISNNKSLNQEPAPFQNILMQR